MASVNAWPWATPEATRQGIAARLRERYPRSELQLRQVEVGFRRLLVRLERADPGRWVIKGGVSLLLQLDPNRTSDDIDLTYIDRAGEHALALRALERSFAVDANDFFAFALTTTRGPEAFDVDRETLGVRVAARIGEREWVQFGVDLARPSEALGSEVLRSAGALTGHPAVDDLPELLTLPLTRQVADKTCAMFERHGRTGMFSTRARDLVDVAMIAGQIATITGHRLSVDLRAEEARRVERGTLLGPLSDRFLLSDDQQTHWKATWTRATRGAPISFDDANAIAERFLTPVLSRAVDGLIWSPQSQRWRPA